MRSVRILIRILAVGTALLLIERFTVEPYITNKVLQRVDLRTHAAVANPQQDRSVILARISIDQLRSIAGAEKDEVTYELLFAANEHILGHLDAVLAHYNAALRFDQRPEIYVNRGATLFDLGREPEAIADFVTAAKFDPDVIETLERRIREQVLARLKG